jgi:hypothetical protein
MDWLILGLAVAAGVGWLAWRGYGISGIASIWLSVIILSGWRMWKSSVLGWPIDLAALIFVISALCIVAASVGAWLRHRAGRYDDHYVDYGDEEPVVPNPSGPVAKPTATDVTASAASGSPRR